MKASRDTLFDPSLKERLQEWTDVDLERDTAVPEQAQLRSLLTQFMENEARSCSMDFGCITPLYIFRMLGGQYPMEEIEEAMLEVRRKRTEG